MYFLFIMGIFINANNILVFKNTENGCIFKVYQALQVEEIQVKSDCKSYFKENLIKVGE